MDNPYQDRVDIVPTVSPEDVHFLGTDPTPEGHGLVPDGAAFTAAFAVWLAAQGLGRFKISGTMAHVKIGGEAYFSVSLVPDVGPMVDLELPEHYEPLFVDAAPAGYKYTGITTGKLYTTHQLPKPDWRIQVSYVRVGGDTKRTATPTVPQPSDVPKSEGEKQLDTRPKW